MNEIAIQKSWRNLFGSSNVYFTNVYFRFNNLEQKQMVFNSFITHYWFTILPASVMKIYLLFASKMYQYCSTLNLCNLSHSAYIVSQILIVPDKPRLLEINPHWTWNIHGLLETHETCTAELFYPTHFSSNFCGYGSNMVGKLNHWGHQ